MGFAPVDITYLTWRQWCDSTSVAGAGNVGKAKSSFKKFIWFVIFVGGLVGTIITLVQVIMAYRDYEVSTSMSLTKYTNLKFPAVTLCNQNRVDCPRLKSVLSTCNANATQCSLGAQGNDSLDTVIDMAQRLQDFACVPNADSNRRKKRSSGSGYVGEQLDASQIGAGSRGGGGGPAPPSQEGLGEVTNEADIDLIKLFMFLEEDNRRAIGHEFDSFIASCTFKNRDCLNSTNFVSRNVPGYGNCYTFNSVLALSDPVGGGRVASLTGPAFGLSIVVNVEQDNYMENELTKQAGARVAVHSEYDIALMDSDGIDVMPSTLTSLSIQEVEITRQPDPFTSFCISEWGNTDYTSYIPLLDGEVKPGWNYTLQLCQRVCLLATFHERCNCTHMSFVDDDSLRLSAPCEVDTAGADYACINAVYDQLDLGATLCDCHTQCQETDFVVLPSVSLFPSDKYEAAAQSAFGFASEGSTKMADNLARVDVYFASLNVQVISEEPVYETWYSNEFISAAGGALSLYLGISIAMFFELVEFFVDLAANAYNYVVKGKRARAGKAEEDISLGGSVTSVGAAPEYATPKKF